MTYPVRTPEIPAKSLSQVRIKTWAKIRKCYRSMQIKIEDFGQNPWGQSVDKNGQSGSGPDPHADKI
jgi:hypothetical protein